ncbi:MAG: hypothetical protein R6U96_02005 [Promethearchaeia archaeon]
MMEETPQSTLSLSPLAYIKSLMYFQRFSSKFIDENQFKMAYGLLLGYTDIDGITVIEDFIPYKQFKKQHIIFKEKHRLIKKIKKLNLKYDDEEFPSYIVGWARNSIDDTRETTLIDKKNHIFFQAIHKNSFFWIFNFGDLTIDYGIKIHEFQEDYKSVNVTTELTELPFTFSKNIYIEDIINLGIEMEDKRDHDEPLIEGIEEDQEDE